MGLSRIIYSNKQMKYEIKENNPYWLNKGPWYNTTTCSKYNGTAFEYFMTNSRKDRYNLIYYITAHDMKQPKYVDDEISDDGI